MPTRLTLFYLSIIIFFNFNSIQAQSDICSEVTEQLQGIHSKFSRLDLETIKLTVDSISALHTEECEMAIYLENVIRGRYYSKKGNIDKALDYLNESNAYAIQKEDIYLKKRMLHYLALAEKERSNFPRSLVLWDSAYHIQCEQDSMKCLKFNVAIAINQASAFNAIGAPEKALEKLHLAEADIIKNEIKDSLYRISLYNTMGNIYDTEFKDFRNSLLAYKKGLHFLPKNHKFEHLLNNNIGNRYKDLNKLDSAALFYTKTINKAKSPRYLVNPYQGLGDIELKNNNLVVAKDYYTKAVAHSVKAKIPQKEIFSRGLVAKTNYLLGEYELAKKQYADILPKLESANFPERDIQKITKYKCLVDIALKDEDLSLEMDTHLNKYDSLTNLNRLATLEKSASKYEKLLLRDSLAKQVLLKENEAEKVKNYRLSTALLIVSLMFLAGLAFQFRKRFSKQKEVNEELVFQNNELQKVNDQLEQKTISLAVNTNKQEVQSELKVQSNDKIYMIPMDNIKYIQAEDDGTRIYYENTSRWTDTSFKKIQELVPTSFFIQIFRSTLVNIKHIGWINSTTLKLKDDTILKIGRTYKQRIKEAIKN